MSRYRRNLQKGGCFFFTVVTHNRCPILINHIERLRFAFQKVIVTYPFVIDAVVILPDHLHAIWRLPESDYNYSLRWRLIKSTFSRGLDIKKNERGEKLVWQRRFWEHTIRDQIDWKNHMDYIHYNPVKHGYVNKVSDWEYSSFHDKVKQCFYKKSWGDLEPVGINNLVLE